MATGQRDLAQPLVDRLQPRPPGAGYLHMLCGLNTSGPQNDLYKEVSGPNRYIAGTGSTDFTGAQLTINLRGELLTRGAEVVLLIQGHEDGICSGWARTGQPFQVTEDWSRQTITLAADPNGWTTLGARHDRTDMYGVKPLDRVLSHVNANIMMVLFPLNVVPMGPLDGDPYILRPERDYPVWRHKLPEGYVMLAEVRTEFP